MISKRFGALLFISASTAAFALGVRLPQNEALKPAATRITPQALRAHTTFLADDVLEGRGTGSRGHEIAARYIASQFENIGLQPAFGESWYQNVPLRRGDLVEKRSFVDLTVSGKKRRLLFGADYIMRGALRSVVDVDSEIVFAGYGISAPALGHDDYQGKDVANRIVAFHAGAPESFSLDQKWFYGSVEEKNATALAKGALATMELIDDDESKPASWNRLRTTAQTIPAMTWEDANGTSLNPPQLFGTICLRAGVAVEIAAGRSPRMHIHQESIVTRPTSPNVAGILPGSDATRKGEYVVFTAHADHLGIGPPQNGDAIYNGAVDNAAGVAALIEVARAFSSIAVRPRRSLMFAAVTAEEPGSIGSDYLLDRPPVARTAIVANVNIDGVSVWPFTAVASRGADHSSLQPAVLAGAEAAGVRVGSEPTAAIRSFMGSDQYSFIRRGIPWFVLAALRTPEARQLALDWAENRYHHPTDDLTQFFDWNAAAEFARVLFTISYFIADAEARPAWNPGDFVGGLSHTLRAVPRD
jgi:hypothetical protein